MDDLYLRVKGNFIFDQILNYGGIFSHIQIVFEDGHSENIRVYTNEEDRDDKSKPRILQNEVEFPAIAKDSSKKRDLSHLRYMVSYLPEADFIPVYDLSLVRMVIRKYYLQFITKKVNRETYQLNCCCNVSNADKY
ncbi:hypothetical protein PPL_09082 [Heterostelium album PN500]|uniref:Uncharacterized protein n=1 Tax=Heterostelium pallidum (strain ATCC 26659 / Pp 5 / PN500) TaxID=670386 RepID=D3BKK0_HETP5|nr:hypothetical protein PPL_09082 [Heterostelium album PN500]EFA78430.1 hypothetical protein PPL_09082 [Heterostelium album PN500]|eukprot:XP_020430555.1 hypothetical protein PPL_09082 [Heterostelium album PN500]